MSTNDSKAKTIVKHVITESAAGRSVRLTQDDQDRLIEMVEAAERLLDKMSTKTWAQREDGFIQWAALYNAIHT